MTDEAPASNLRRDDQLARSAQRARLTRFLKRGGVLVRDVCGGAVGVRWARASRTGSDFDAAVCERRLEEGRLRHVPGTTSAFHAPPPRS